MDLAIYQRHFGCIESLIDLGMDPFKVAPRAVAIACTACVGAFCAPIGPPPPPFSTLTGGHLPLGPL